MTKDTNQFSEIERGEVLSSGRRRRRWTFTEKLRAAQEASAPGSSVSSVARKYGMAPSQLFRWRKLILSEGTEVSPSDGGNSLSVEVRELKLQIRELERLLGKKTHENEILKERIAQGKSKQQLCLDHRKDGCAF
jgi:transposase